MSPLVLASFHHVAGPDWRRYFHTILRAGRVQASSDYVVRRDYYVGQDLLFCLKGGGWIESLGKKYKVAPNQLAWIANEQIHAHGADPNNPWEFLWLRLDGPGLAKIRALLFTHGTPILSFNDSAQIVGWFSRLFRLLEKATPRTDLKLNELAAELFCILGNRLNKHASQENWISFPDSLRRVIQEIRLHPEQRWSITSMARLASLSPSKLRRLAAHFLHMSPQQWLIRERIAFAQNLLAENEYSVSEISDRCGYGDIYHFSREFKRHMGLSPLAFRKSEILSRLEPKV